MKINSNKYSNGTPLHLLYNSFNNKISLKVFSLFSEYLLAISWEIL